MSAVFAPPLWSWTHHDDELAAAADRAMDRSFGGGWRARGVARDLRAMAARSVVAASSLCKNPATTTGPTITVNDLGGSGFADGDHELFAACLTRTIEVVTLGEAPRKRTVTTVAGERASFAPLFNAEGWHVVAGVAVVAGIAGYVIAAAYLGEQTAFVADRAFRRADLGDKLMQSHATLLQLIEQHAAQERALGKVLPFNEAEKAALAALLNEHSRFVDATLGESPMNAPTRPFAGTGGGLGLGLGLGAALVGGYMLSRPGH